MKAKALLMASGKSNRALGRLVHEAWKRQAARGESVPSAASIAVKIGDLGKNDGWWRTHPVALHELARILGCRPEDLAPPDASTPQPVVIRAFHELAPILPGQDACPLADGGSWLGGWVERAHREEPRTWIVAAAGSGKSLALDVMRQRHGARLATVRARRLLDAVSPEVQTRVPRVIELAELDATTDVTALGELSVQASNVCVLAPFPRRLIPVATQARWLDLEWRPADGWRDRLLRWASARARTPEKVDVAEALDWLELVDPHARLFCTPGDVLALAAWAYRSGALPKRGRLDDLARDGVSRQVQAIECEWLRRLGPDAAASMLAARLRDADVPFEPLPLSTWARLLPAELRSTRKESTARRTGRAATRDPVPALEGVHMLAEAEVLRATATGDYDFAPWVREGIERAELHRSIRGDEDWPLLGLDPRRRITLDATLDALSPPELMVRVRHALTGGRSDIQSVAAIEALFSALGRRMRDHAWRPTTDMVSDLQHLAVRQVALIGALPESRGFPHFPALTRQSPTHDATDAAGWLSEAWAFSFAVKAPAQLDEDPGWVLPGWSADLRLSDPATSLLPIVRPGSPLLALADLAVERCKDDAVPPRAPQALLAAIVRHAHRRAWTLPDITLRAVHQNYHVAEILGRALNNVTDPDVLLLAWRSCLVACDGHALHALEDLRGRAPSLRRAFLEALPEEVFREAVAASPGFPLDAARLLDALPPRLLRPALEGVARTWRVDVGVDELSPFFARLEADALEVIIDFVQAPRETDRAAARRVWELAPDAALDQARACLDAGSIAAGVWFDEAPGARLRELTLLLESRRALPEWCAGFLVKALSRSGSAAGAVHALLLRA